MAKVYITVEFDTDNKYVVEDILEYLKVYVPRIATNVRYSTNSPWVN